MITRHIIDTKQKIFLKLILKVYPKYYPKFITRIMRDMTYTNKTDYTQLKMISDNIKYMLRLSPVELQRWKLEKEKLNEYGNDI